MFSSDVSARFDDNNSACGNGIPMKQLKGRRLGGCGDGNNLRSRKAKKVHEALIDMCQNSPKAFTVDWKLGPEDREVNN